jgi:hypothetical protein
MTSIYVDDCVLRSYSVMVWMLLSCMCDCMRLRVQSLVIVNPYYFYQRKISLCYLITVILCKI